MLTAHQALDAAAAQRQAWARHSREVDEQCFRKRICPHAALCVQSDTGKERETLSRQLSDVRIGTDLRGMGGDKGIRTPG